MRLILKIKFVLKRKIIDQQKENKREWEEVYTRTLMAEENESNHGNLSKDDISSAHAVRHEETARLDR